MPKFTKLVTEITPDLFHTRIALPEVSGTQIENDIWFIFFDSSNCGRGCRLIDETWEDLSLLKAGELNAKIAHLVCPRYGALCQRLGIIGWPTLSIVSGGQVYDY